MKTYSEIRSKHSFPLTPDDVIAMLGVGTTEACDQMCLESLCSEARGMLITVATELEEYRERFGPLDDEPPNPYKHADTPFADNH